MEKLAIIGLLGGAFASVFAIVENSQPATILAVGLMLASFEVYVLARLAGGFTAVVVPVVAVNSVLLTSLFLWDRVRAESIVSIRLQVPESYHIHAALIGVVFSAAYTVGAVVAGPRSVRMSLGELGATITRLGNSFRIPTGALVAVGYAGVALTIYARQGALIEGRYLEANGPDWALNLSNALTPLSMLVLCIAAAKPGRWRWLAAVGVGAWFIILFGRASRSIAYLPAMILFARYFAAGQKVRPTHVGIAAAATTVLLQLPLVGRLNPGGVGVLPLSEQLLARPAEVFSQFSLGALLGNVLFSGPVTAVVANRPIPAEAFWISINPMPGVFAGWYEIRDTLRVDRSTPYNALGELGAHGWVALVAIAVAIGFLISLSTRIASNLRGAYAMTAILLVFGVTIFFSLSILQYNLRSSVRLVWYMVFGVGAIWFVSVALRPRHSEAHSHASGYAERSS